VLSRSRSQDSSVLGAFLDPSAIVVLFNGAGPSQRIALEGRELSLKPLPDEDAGWRWVLFCFSLDAHPFQQG
jgi:hypothetical protein